MIVEKLSDDNQYQIARLTNLDEFMWGMHIIHIIQQSTHTHTVKNEKQLKK